MFVSYLITTLSHFPPHTSLSEMIGIESMTFATHLHLEFGDSALQSQQLLLESSFFSLKRSDLLLDATVLGLLEVEVSFPE